MEGKDVTKKEEAQMEGKDVTKKEEAQMEGKDATKKEEAQSTETQKWGTKLMVVQSQNYEKSDLLLVTQWSSFEHKKQEAAQWKARESDEELPPYVLREPLQQNNRPNVSPMEHILNYFNTWTKSAEELASNIWRNLQMAPSAPEAAMGKISLTAKALSGGGFESLYKQTFNSDPSEHLKKTFACYLSTATGPVAGLMELLQGSGASWENSTCEPGKMKETPPEKYIQIVTVDGHEFWFMGFVSYDKAMKNLLDSVANYNATTKHVA
ncbi:ABA-responsive protein [Carex littledalei]|uniref:ABA-responsive protein n=1 Tax=Carex littledalei TaxID=544730 RepID=A0A833QUE7_9POAL|nr:ABA-responsive protein [Carex littledalei]